MSNSHPPKFLLRLLKWFCKSSYHIDIEGDLLELYERNEEKYGKRKANYILAKDVLRLFRPGMIKSFVSPRQLGTLSMFNNYIKVSRRNLLKQKQYAFINIAGLSIGIVCFILISLFVDHERSFDRFYNDVDSIYHVYERSPGDLYLGSDSYSVTPAQLAPTLMENYPEVDYATTVSEDDGLLGDGEQSFYWEKGLFVDPNFFNVFSHPEFVQGDPNTVFDHPESIVLTQSLANKMFRKNNAVGKTLVFRDKIYTITGIVDDQPQNATFQFSFLANLKADQRYLNEFKKDKWDGSNYYTFFNLKPSASLSSLHGKMPDMVDRYWIDDLTFDIEYHFQPFSAIHMRTDINNDFQLKGSPQQVSLFITIAVLILALACINYMNLSIARSMSRAKEVGLRKTIGAERNQLIVQFLLESVMLSFVALIIALGIVSLILPEFGALLNRELNVNILLEKPRLMLGITAVVTLIGIISGSYPALGISGLKPIHVLKGNATNQVKGGSLQRWLIVGQYAISTVMVICTIIMYQQFQFIGDKELGFEQDQIITVEVSDPNVRRNFNALKSEWASNPDILAIGTSQNLPHEVRSSTIVNDDTGGDPDDDFAVQRLRVGHEFLDIYELELIAGNYLTVDSGERTCLVNESAVKALGLSPKEAIGHVITDDSPRNYRTIVGVVKDFHSLSMHLEISPLLIESRTYFQYISFKIRAENTRELIASMENTWKQYSNYPFDFQFMDERVNRLYAADQQRATLFSSFSALAIIIASLGLFGLAALQAQQRVKEIGIRKVLGASIQSILGLVTGSFLKMIFAGFIIAIPVAWFLMDTWLQNYAYRIGIEWWVFALAGAAAILIAVLSISSQSIKAALVNPVECLRGE